VENRRVTQGGVWGAQVTVKDGKGSKWSNDQAISPEWRCGAKTGGERGDDCRAKMEQIKNFEEKWKQFSPVNKAGAVHESSQKRQKGCVGKSGVRKKKDPQIGKKKTRGRGKDVTFHHMVSQKGKNKFTKAHNGEKLKEDVKDSKK